MAQAMASVCARFRAPIASPPRDATTDSCGTGKPGRTRGDSKKKEPKIPGNEQSLPTALPEGAQVLRNKARAGAAFTEDLLHLCDSF